VLAMHDFFSRFDDPLGKKKLIFFCTWI
jgi:hypothetical protein